MARLVITGEARAFCESEQSDRREVDSMKKNCSGTKATGGKGKGTKIVTGSSTAGRYGPGGNGTPKKKYR